MNTINAKNCCKFLKFTVMVFSKLVSVVIVVIHHYLLADFVPWLVRSKIMVSLKLKVQNDSCKGVFGNPSDKTWQAM